MKTASRKIPRVSSTTEVLLRELREECEKVVDLIRRLDEGPVSPRERDEVLGELSAAVLHLHSHTAGLDQFLCHLVMQSQSAALIVRSVRPAHVRSFVPIESGPAQVLERCLRILRTATLRIDVFVAIDEHSTGRPRTLPRGAKGREMAEVQETGRRRC